MLAFLYSCSIIFLEHFKNQYSLNTPNSIFSECCLQTEKLHQKLLDTRVDLNPQETTAFHYMRANKDQNGRDLDSGA